MTTEEAFRITKVIMDTVGMVSYTISANAHGENILVSVREEDSGKKLASVWFDKGVIEHVVFTPGWKED